MAAVTPTVVNVRPGYQSVVIPVVSGVSASLGDAMTTGLDGLAAKSANASGKAQGLIVSGSRKATDGSIVAGETIGLCVFGPVEGFSGLTPGRLIYLDSTAGKLSDSGSVAIGYAMTDTTIFVMPALATAAS